jgi:hypothetical protein
MQVIQDFFDEEVYKKLENLFLDPMFDWHYTSPTATIFNDDGYDTGEPMDNNYMFAHTFYHAMEDGFTIISPYMQEFIEPTLWAIKNTLGFSDPIKIKAGLYTNQGKVNKTGIHTDFPEHTNKGLGIYTTMIYHINDNNGSTVVDDDNTGLMYRAEVPQKANQMVVFDGSKNHYGATQTDTKVRLVLNYNFSM